MVFATVTELDAIKYVGNSALNLLRDYAGSHGYVDGLAPGAADPDRGRRERTRKRTPDPSGRAQVPDGAGFGSQ